MGEIQKKFRGEWLLHRGGGGIEKVSRTDEEGCEGVSANSHVCKDKVRKC